jgi:GT2 family glycosyltransferase
MTTATNCCAILVNYNGAMDTAQAAWSVRADHPALDLLVVDNSQSEAESTQLRALLPTGTRLIIAPENIGFGRACNLAFEACQHEFVFLVNPDVRLIAGCTAHLLATMQANPRLAAVAPQQFLDDACRWKLSPSWFPTALREWATELAFRNPRHAQSLGRAVRAEKLRLWSNKTAVLQRALSGGAMLIRRSAIAQTAEPLFDPRFFMYFEDSDLCRRLNQHGRQIAVEPKAQAIHRWRNQPHKGRLMVAALELYFAKYGGTSDSWRAKAARLAALPWSNAGQDQVATFPAEGFIVPEAWRDGWVLELGLNPLFIPSIGRLGVGSVAEFPHDVIANFEGARVFGRIGSVNPSEANYWNFEVNYLKSASPPVSHHLSISSSGPGPGVQVLAPMAMPRSDTLASPPK